MGPPTGYGRQGRKDIEQAKPLGGNAGALILELVEKDTHKLHRLAEKGRSHQQRGVGEAPAQRGTQGGTLLRGRRCPRRVGEKEGEQRGQSVGGHGPTSSGPVVVAEKKRGAHPCRHQSGCLYSSPQPKAPLAVPPAAAGIEIGRVTAGEPGQRRRQNETLQQKVPQAIRPPKDHLGEGIEGGTHHDHPPVAQPVGRPTPGELQQQHNGH